MRKSNIRYGKGSIIFVKNTVATKFLIRRPCIIVSNPTHIMGTYIICCCGTQDHPGIRISLYNDDKQKYIGEKKFSNIYPYNLYSISIGDIRCCVGQLDPFIMNAVDKAIDFHLGRTTEVPKYLEGWEEMLFGVEYHKMKLSDIYESDLKPLGDLFESENKYRSYPLELSIHSDDELTDEVSDDEIDEVSLSASDPDNEDSEISTITEEWVESSYSGPSITMDNILDSEFRLNNFDLEDTCMIISRQYVGNIDICTKYGLVIGEANELRNNLTMDAMSLAYRILHDEQVSGKVSIPNKTDEMYLGMLLIQFVTPLTASNLNIQKYSKQLKEIKKKYDINFGDRQKWYNITEIEGYARS